MAEHLYSPPFLVGDDPASATYVKMKGNACRELAWSRWPLNCPASTQAPMTLLREIEQLNANPDVHGILLQHPVPSHIDERAAST
jgi:methylenetetrahydrofolate dehydrogenase (NADP+)/methenyltetrahydrofolate cyclohydrolase